eukprot:1148064-Pelagomonas_calceolata.AAC.3
MVLGVLAKAEEMHTRQAGKVETKRRCLQSDIMMAGGELRAHTLFYSKDPQHLVHYEDISGCLGQELVIESAFMSC